jgi:hypothetical protein
MAWLEQSLGHIQHRWGIKRGWLLIGLAVAAWVLVFAVGWGAYQIVQIFLA